MGQVLNVSRYNYFFPRDGAVIGYNARTGSFALLAPDVAQALADQSEIRQIRDRDSLLKMGFLFDGDELSAIESQYVHARTQADSVVFTFVPTMACDLRCDYCFQNAYRTSQSMSLETQQATLRFVRETVAGGRRNVKCTWFGGEPLQEKNTVLSMSRRMQKIISQENGSLRSMQIITNGMQLDTSTARDLAIAGIASAQITFDALEFEFPSKRGVVDSTGHPSPILRNALDAREHLAIDIRVNVSTENEHELPLILEVLRNHGLGSSISLGRVHNNESETGFATLADGARVQGNETNLLPIIGDSPVETLSRAQFATLERDQLLSDERLMHRVVQKLKPRSHFCSATSNTLLLVDPAGDVSRCWHSAGCPSEAIGNVNDSEWVKEASSNASWQAYSPFRYKACEGCKVLPLCMGGCAHPRIFMNARHPPCESIKQNIQWCVERVGDALEVSDEQLQAVLPERQSAVS